ncbi:MAG: hypothetical protein GY849_15995, partial [Deltaproteobacteria bacterium]|nr:hypothetical protein [Deltaproteobacteria bacterium]
MIKKEFILREGTSQKGRRPKALEEGYVSIDERTPEDLLKYARSLAEHIKFYNDVNREDGDWSAFFDGDVDEMISFMHNPEPFLEDEEKMKRLSRPNLVLFLTFLQLLRHPQEQFAGLTRRHLDLYYRDILRFHERKGRPDQVHVMFELSPDTNQQAIQKGALLSAGVDSLENALHYAVDENFVVTRARIADIRTVYVNKKYAGLRTIHWRYENGLEKMLKWALGHPNQGDPFP